MYSRRRWFSGYARRAEHQRFRLRQQFNQRRPVQVAPVQHHARDLLRVPDVLERIVKQTSRYSPGVSSASKKASIPGATVAVSLGYRHAINWIRRAEARLERPLVVRHADGTSGGGSALTAEGIALVRRTSR